MVSMNQALTKLLERFIHYHQNTFLLFLEVIAQLLICLTKVQLQLR